jgi:hypothetical protein
LSEFGGGIVATGISRKDVFVHVSIGKSFIFANCSNILVYFVEKNNNGY